MRKLFICLGWLTSIAIALAQPAIEKDHNLLRVDDYLFKQQVEFVSPGTSGENQFWDFSNLKVIEESYKVSHMEYPDSLLIARELRSLYKYALKGDTLVNTGIENTTTLMEYIHPQLQLIFPVNYGDRNQNHFYGEGHYCRQLKLTINGIAAYHADAWGEMLLPEGDTLTNVLRVKHTVKQVEEQKVYDPYYIPDSVSPGIRSEYSIVNDSLWTEVETYKWYVPGYRYPVFESIRYYSHYQGNKELKKQTSFYYPPHEQFYGLEDDPQNREYREKGAMERELLARKKKNQDAPDNGLENAGSAFSYSLHHNRQEGIVTLEYQVPHATEVSILLTDIQGKLLLQLPKVWKEVGEYQEDIPLNNYIREEYLIKIVTDSKIYTEKLIN